MTNEPPRREASPTPDVRESEPATGSNSVATGVPPRVARQFDGIVEAAARNDLVLFVGAGVSAAAGIPAWKNYAEALLGELKDDHPEAYEQMRDLIGRGQLVDALTCAKEALGGPDFCTATEAILDDRHVDVPPVASELARLAEYVRLVFTTNLDRILERAFPDSWAPIVGLVPDVLQRSESIIKLHGTLVQRDSWVFTREEYGRAVHINPVHIKTLESLFRSRTILFVGYGIQDLDIDGILEQFRVESDGQPPRHYAILPKSIGSYLRKRYSKAGVSIIQYDDSRGHGEVLNLLKGLLKTLEQRRRNGSVAQADAYPMAEGSSRPGNAAREADANADRLAVLHNLPSSRPFVGRSRLQISIARELAETGRVTLCGLGGMGKSSAALAFASAALARNAYPGGVFWVDAQHRPEEGLAALELLLMARQGAVDLSGASGAPRPSAAERVRLLLGMSSAPTLVVLDDIEGDWSKHLPGGNNTHILVTGRDVGVALGGALPVSGLALDEARELALLHCREDSDEWERRVRDLVIVTDLGGMPLAIEIASKAVTALSLSWSEYRSLLQEEARSALEPTYASPDYPRGVFAAIDLSIQRCAEGSPERELLFAVARFAPEPMHRSWAWEVANLRLPTLETKKCEARLRDLGLLQEIQPNEVWRLHSLVHLRVVELLPNDDMALRRVAAVVGRAADSHEPLLTLRQLEVGRAAAEACQNAVAEVAILLLASHEWRRAGVYDHAVRDLKRALEIAEVHGALQESRIADLRNFLGLILNEVGQRREAEAQLREALRLREALLNSDDLDLAVTRINLSICYSDQGRFGEALDQARKALDAEFRNPERFNPDRAKFLTIYGSLVLHEASGEEAQEILEGALAWAERVYGPEHPDLAGPLSTLVHCYGSAGRTVDAVRAASRAVEVTLRAYGGQHPRVAQMRLVLGAALFSADHREAAENELREVIQLCRHLRFMPPLIPALSRLGTELVHQGQLDAGLCLLDEAIGLLSQEQQSDSALSDHIRGELARALRTRAHREQRAERIRTLERALEVEESRTPVQAASRRLTLLLLSRETVSHDDTSSCAEMGLNQGDMSHRKELAEAIYVLTLDLLNAGLLESALGLATSVVEEFQRIDPDISIEAIMANHALARCYAYAGRVDDARKQIYHVVDMIGAYPPQAFQECGELRLQGADLLGYIGDHSEAADILVGHLQVADAVFDPPYFLATLSGLVQYANRDDVFPEALRRAISLALGRWKAEVHPPAMEVLGRAARLWLRHGPAKEAVESAQRARADARRTSGPDSVAYAVWCSNLGLAQRLAGQRRESRANLREAVQIGTRHLGSDDKLLAWMKANLALPALSKPSDKKKRRKRRRSR